MAGVPVRGRASAGELRRLVACHRRRGPLAGCLGFARDAVRPQASTALEVHATGAPQRVYGSDGRGHIEYDLVVTNLFSADATLLSLELRGEAGRC
jgi:hypothetical protein